MQIKPALCDTRSVQCSCSAAQHRDGISLNIAPDDRAFQPTLRDGRATPIIICNCNFYLNLRYSCLCTSSPSKHCASSGAYHPGSANALAHWHTTLMHAGRRFLDAEEVFNTVDWVNGYVVFNVGATSTASLPTSCSGRKPSSSSMSLRTRSTTHGSRNPHLAELARSYDAFRTVAGVGAIRSEADHRRALALIEAILDETRDTPARGRLASAGRSAGSVDGGSA